MSGKYSNYDWLPKQKKCLKSKTVSGWIKIAFTDKFGHAVDNEGNEIARTYEVSEKGMQWLKIQCRGWGGWSRLNWEISEL